MKMRKKETNDNIGADRSRLRRAMEALATFGLLVVALAMAGPFAGLLTPGWMTAFKWIYAAGALAYLVARITGAVGKDESLRVRRLRRMEVWAGIAFAVASFFWFFNTRGFNGLPTFHMLNETIIFTLAGALIQVIASWMLASALKKEQNNK